MNDLLIGERLKALAGSSFRAQFHLDQKDKAYIDKKGLADIRKHAEKLLLNRLFVKTPERDGKQTPYKGHPVFKAQHATATCCRSCLMRWHKIPKDHVVNSEEQAYILDVIETWLTEEYKKLPATQPTREKAKALRTQIRLPL